MIQNEFTYLSQAFNEESWEWLQDANIKLARALHAEVNRGATAGRRHTPVHHALHRASGHSRENGTGGGIPAESESGGAMSKSELETAMLLHLHVNDLPPPEQEHKFHPRRKWRFDFAWPGEMLALEVEGGIYMDKSGHNTAAGITRDCEKYNEAVLLGWKVIRVTSDHIADGSAIDWIRRALVSQGADPAPF